MAFTRLLRSLAARQGFGPRVVPIIPDEARTFGMDAPVQGVRHLRLAGPDATSPSTTTLLLSYTESAATASSSRRASPRPAAWPASPRPARPTPPGACPMVPFFIFYSMFGFQRVGDLIWAAADARARGFLLGATAGRTTLLGEGLQHQDGHSLVLASTVPRVRPTTRRSPTRWPTIVRHGIHRMYGPEPEDVVLLPHPLQRELRDAAACPTAPPRASSRASTAGPPRPRASTAAATILFSRHRPGRGPLRPGRAGRALRHRRRAVERDLLQAAARGGPRRRALEPPAPRRAAPARPGSPSCWPTHRARSSPSPTS